MSTFPTGWVEFEERTNEQNDIHDAIVAKMPKFATPKTVFGGTPPVGTKIVLCDIWKHPAVIAALGFAFTGVHQITGSCVGAAGGNMLFTTAAMDVLDKGEPEKLVMPFWLYNYGQSRARAGMRGQGEGSFGSTFADSCKLDGSPDSKDVALQLPGPSNVDDGLIWGKNVEMKWSDGRTASDDVKNISKQHLIQTVQPVSTGPDVRDMIINKYAITRASSLYVNPGTGRIKDGAIVGAYNGRGGHQETWLGYWHHPTLGELILEMNQWGLDIYSKDPTLAPLGGIWIPLELVDRMCQSNDAEVYAFSNYEGYPEQSHKFDWDRNKFYS